MAQHWRVEYISCEGNYRHCTVRTPDDWTEDDIRHGMMSFGSIGDDPAEVTEMYNLSEYWYDENLDYSYDFL
jgi:hypothetical protein